MTDDQCPSCGRPAQSSIVLSGGMRVVGCPCVEPGFARFVDLAPLVAKISALGGRPDCVHVNPDRVNAARKIWFRMAWFRMCVT